MAASFPQSECGKRNTNTTMAFYNLASLIKNILLIAKLVIALCRSSVFNEGLSVFKVEPPKKEFFQPSRI